MFSENNMLEESRNEQFVSQVSSEKNMDKIENGSVSSEDLSSLEDRQFVASTGHQPTVSEESSGIEDLKEATYNKGIPKDDLSPREIVEELNRYIIGQAEAKRALAIAVRNRRRRMKLPLWLRQEVTPKNILMRGPSGVGKTEAVRRIARITHCPFIKVEATKFTEVGYIGRDVDSIPRDLVDYAFKTLKQEEIENLSSQVKEAVEERILDCFVRETAGHVPSSTSDLKQIEKDLARNVYRKRLQAGLLDEQEIEIELTNQSAGVEIMGPPGMEEMTHQLQSMMQSLSSGRVRTHRMKVKEAIKLVEQEEADKLLNEEDLKRRAIEWVEEYGIVFIDEIDKVCRRGDISSSDVSREGVQRDLLPLIEGSTVSTKYGIVRTDHILFITAGAFQGGQKPSDLIPELQGRLPIRVELHPLTAKDFQRILSECHASLITQYQALMKIEGVDIQFTKEAIERIAEIAYLVNERVENIGARRLYTVMERLLEDLSFEASDLKDKQVLVDVEYVERELASLAEDEDSSHYIL